MNESEQHIFIMNEEDARRFLKKWPDLINSVDSQVRAILSDALQVLEDYHQLDVVAFYLACLNHSDDLVRLAALHALTSRLERIKGSSEEIVAVFRVLNNDTNPIIRGGAAWCLGKIAHVNDIPGALSSLLTIVDNRNEHNRVRLDAYKGIIYLLNREGDPKYHPFNIRFDQPVDEQVDWNWIEELRRKVDI